MSRRETRAAWLRLCGRSRVTDVKAAAERSNANDVSIWTLVQGIPNQLYTAFMQPTAFVTLISLQSPSITFLFQLYYLSLRFHRSPLSLPGITNSPFDYQIFA